MRYMIAWTLILAVAVSLAACATTDTTTTLDDGTTVTTRTWSVDIEKAQKAVDLARQTYDTFHPAEAEKDPAQVAAEREQKKQEVQDALDALARLQALKNGGSANVSTTLSDGTVLKSTATAAAVTNTGGSEQ